MIRYERKGDPGSGIHTATQTAFVHVSAPQWVILFGAMIGGLLAYLITLLFPSLRKREAGNDGKGRQFLRLIAGAIGAVLLAAIVTILLARLSDTQFLIKVSVNDLWGAIAVGFVSDLVGVKILDKIVGKTEMLPLMIRADAEDIRRGRGKIRPGSREFRSGRRNVRSRREKPEAGG